MALNFQAFIDESVSPNDGDFILGGCIAPAEKWAEFSREWEALLPYGTRAKNGNFHFKMSEMASNAQRMARVPLFSDVIDKYIHDFISCRMNLADFAQAQERFESFARVMNWSVDFGPFLNPYYFTFWILLKAFHKDREKFASHIPVDEKVDFYFDNRSEKKPLLEAWDGFLPKLDDVMRARYGATPRFEDDQEFLALQAADFWAWWVREWYEEDAAELPDKMLKFDFGTWIGKDRRFITIYLTEDFIFEEMQSMAVDSLLQDETMRPGFNVT